MFGTKYADQIVQASYLTSAYYHHHWQRNHYISHTPPPNKKWATETNRCVCVQERERERERVDWESQTRFWSVEGLWQLKRMLKRKEVTARESGCLHKNHTTRLFFSSFLPSSSHPFFSVVVVVVVVFSFLSF